MKERIEVIVALFALMVAIIALVFSIWCYRETEKIFKGIDNHGNSTVSNNTRQGEPVKTNG